MTADWYRTLLKRLTARILLIESLIVHAPEGRMLKSFRSMGISVLVGAMCAFVLPIFLTSAHAQSRFVRQSTSAQSVIVFVHGVIGNSVSTWTNGNVYWPTLLAQDQVFNDSDIYVYEYPTSALRSTFSIDEIAENMRLIFDADGVSKYNSCTQYGRLGYPRIYFEIPVYSA